MQQQNLSFQFDETALNAFLEEKTGRVISLVITDNATSMLSVRNKGHHVFLRLHRIFLSADEPVLEEISGFIKNRNMKTPFVRDFIRQNKDKLKKAAPRRTRILTKGKSYDLSDVYDSINEEYFSGKISASITWGAKRPVRAAARRTLGSFCGNNNMIRISPILDSERVPRYFLEFVVYHEMLHADIGINTKGGRRLHHDREFKKREKLFKYYNRAIAWEKKSL